MQRVPFLKRGSWVSANGGAASRNNSLRGSLLGTAALRDMLAAQAELDKTIFDSSLGSPLSSFDTATLELVGGKALQCWRLAKHGFPVPKAFVIPTYVYSMHIGDAGAVGLINEVFNSNWKDEAVREANKEKLDRIRERILATPLNEEVVENLETFLATSIGDDEFCAVRSSGSSEDLASQSFAGQYDTFLYKRTLEEISESVKLCWASMFKHHILDYAAKTDEEVLSLKPPKMGVLIMKQVESRASGVCFSQNVWGSKKEVMIEAVLGQGEGLVSGEITPDRHVLNKYNTNLCYQDLHQQKAMFVKADNQDGVVKQILENPHEGPVLEEHDLKTIARLARAVEDFYNKPQDIEWAIGKNGKVYLLQARPITASDNHASLSYLPPGPGFWTFDPTHFPRPMSPWMCETYGFGEYGKMGRRAGCLVKDVKVRFIHSFAFTQPEFRPPSEALERAAKAYWEKKLYEDDYREFNDFFKPDCIAMQQELRSVNPSSLGHRSLVEYISKCYDYATKFWNLHHTYSAPTMLIVGDFMNQMGSLAGKDPMDTLPLLENASPESRGILNLQDPLLAKMYKELKGNKRAMELLQSDEANASWALDCLLHLPGELGEMMREVALVYGWRLAGGYDLVVPCLIESPTFFLKTLLQGVQMDCEKLQETEKKILERIAEWKALVPADKHDEFDEILAVGRNFFRIRDERGLCTDLSGVGLCRRGLLEGGKRLVDLGVLDKAEHLTVATRSEAMALLSGDLSLLQVNGGTEGIVDIPTPRELARRYKHIMTADPNLVPRTLGTPPPAPDNSALPPNMARTMAALDVGLLKGIWDEGNHDDLAIAKDPDRVKGVPASMGKVVGPVCLVVNDDDLKKVKKGDIVITYSSSASFNIVLGLCAGICTDYGGMLSHAAIVAREYGIPAVVGTQAATQKFKDGDLVCIDSVACTVTRVGA